MAYTETEIMALLKMGSGQLYNEDIIQFIESKNNTIRCQQAEIERLQKNNHKLATEMAKKLQHLPTLRAEAVKKCLEKLKEEMLESKYKVNDTVYSRACNSVVDFWVSNIDHRLKALKEFEEQ